MQPWVQEQRGWRFLFHAQRAHEWLAANSPLSPEAARAQVESVNVGADFPLCSLAGTPRGLLGLLATLAQNPGGFIFHTMGMDPLGVNTALKTAFKNVGDAAGIYCQNHVMTGGRIVLEDLPFPFANTITVESALSINQRIAG